MMRFSCRRTASCSKRRRRASSSASAIASSPPRPAGGILHGTTQVSLFDHLRERGFETAYEVLPAAKLAQADAAWLVSSVRLAAPIVAIDGVALAHDAELTASLNQYLLSPRD